MQRALGSAKGNSLGIEIDECHVGVRPHPDIRAPHLYLGAPVGVSVDTVAWAKGVIQVGLAPILATRWLDGDVPVHDRQPARLGRRIVVLRHSGDGEYREARRCRKCHKAGFEGSVGTMFHSGSFLSIAAATPARGSVITGEIEAQRFYLSDPERNERHEKPNLGTCHVHGNPIYAKK
jgi:hypothetical protein